MNKKVYSILLLCFLFLIDYAQAASWTYMVYMDADNNLESDGIDDFLEMSSVGSSSDVNVIVQFDRIRGESYAYGNWTDCKRFRISKGSTPDPMYAIESIGEVNMGDPKTLTEFINWTTLHYPADKYALILWNHGEGWRKYWTASYQDHQTKHLTDDKPLFKAICYDNTNGSDSLTLKELKQALNDTEEDMNLIGFDACLMGMIEVAYEIKDTGASIMVASALTEPAEGWHYQPIIRLLNMNPDCTPDQLAIAIIDYYFESDSKYKTLSAIHLSQMNSIGLALNEFCQSLMNDNLYQARLTATQLQKELKQLILYEKHDASFTGSHGLAIYFPSLATEFHSSYNATTLDLLKDTLWNNFLTTYYQTLSDTWINQIRLGTQMYDDEYTPENSTHIDLSDFVNNVIQLTDITPETYTFNDTWPYSFEDISTTGIRLGIEWDNSKGFSIPFEFIYHAKPYSMIYASAHGTIHFLDGEVIPYDSECIPASKPSSPFIAAFWDDFDPVENKGAVLYEVKGDAPNRRLIVQWDNVPRYETKGSVTFEIILQETSNQIIFQYKDVIVENQFYDSGIKATIGLNYNPFKGVQYGCKSPVLKNNMAIQFLPTVSQLQGDVNADGQVKLDDAIQLLQINAGIYHLFYHMQADFNGDQKFDYIDIMSIFRIISSNK